MHKLTILIFKKSNTKRIPFPVAGERDTSPDTQPPRRVVFQPPPLKISDYAAGKVREVTSADVVDERRHRRASLSETC